MVRFLDLSISDPQERAALVDCYEKVLGHGQLVIGPEVGKFEEEIASYCGRKYSVGVGSGTDALYFALRALDVGHGDEVITTCLSWIATANAVRITGANPVFADIQDDLNINPDSVTRLITSRTKAILAVDYTGRICDMDSLAQIADQHNLYLIEDGSQSFGAEFKSRRCGSFGIISAISHNPMKVLAACGEAGSVLCDDEKIFNRLISLRYNGTVNREVCIEPSLNGRIDTIQAAILLYRLGTFEALVDRRRENAEYYRSVLEGLVEIPKRTEDRKDVFYTYTIRTSKRDQLREYLEERGIQTKIQHPLLMSEQPAYNGFSRDDLKRGSKLVKEILCIPIHEKLTPEERQYVAKSIENFFS